jgi:DNA-binding SARP family transcriptional activator
MAPIAASALNEPYSKILEHNGQKAYIQALCEIGIPWFLEMDFGVLYAHLTPLRSPNPDGHLPSRISFLLDATTTDISPVELFNWHRRFLDEEDVEGSIAALSAGVAAIVNSGSCMSRMSPFFDRCMDLLRWEEAMDPLARAVLYGTMATVYQWWKGDVPRFRQTIGQAILFAEKAKSNALRLSYSCQLIHLLSMAGDQTQADVLIMETEPLCKLPGMPAASVLMHQYMRGLLLMNRGKLVESIGFYKGIIEKPAFGDVPPLFWIMVQGSMLMTVSMSGDEQASSELSHAYAARCIPEQNYVGSSFVHYCMAVAALVQGHPYKAWLHSNKSQELGQRSECLWVEGLPMLVLAQSLADMDRRDEAMELLLEWIPRWRSWEFGILAVTGAMEMANMLLKSGDAEEAAHYCSMAEAIVGKGVKVIVFNRGPHFVERIHRELSMGDYGWGIYRKPFIHIRTFGGLRVEVDGRQVEERAWQGTRTKTLLKLLLAQGGSRISTETLLDHMWPDADGDTAMNAFKTTLSRLRRVVGLNGEHPIEWISVHHRKVSLDTACCRVDAFEFRKRISYAMRSGSAEQLAAALDLYTDDFLPDDVDHDGIKRQRQDLIEEYARGVQRYAECCLKEGRPEMAVPYLERALEKSPLHEVICACLMRCHEDFGLHVRALQVYRSVEERVRREIGTEPSLLLTALAHRIKAKTSLQLHSLS